MLLLRGKDSASTRVGVDFVSSTVLALEEHGFCFSPPVTQEIESQDAWIDMNDNFSRKQQNQRCSKSELIDSINY